MILKLKFKFEKETPGTVRYQEVGASTPSVPTLYVRKSAMPDGRIPQHVSAELVFT